MTDQPTYDDDAALPNELPPVEPPSAGFILQLFLIPALIIGVIVGVVFVFGLMASSQDDWRDLVQKVGSPNGDIRWRAAMGLAQMLSLDDKKENSEENLVGNRQVADALCGLLNEELSRTSPNEDEIQTQAFLTRAVQLLRVPDVVVPTLIRAIDADQDLEVRKNGLAAVAIVANRAQEAGQPLNAELTAALTEKLTEVSAEMTPADSAPLMRQMGAFALGMLDSEQATARLQILLDDSNPATRANAMIGLARHEDASGFPVLVEILESAARAPQEDDDAFERFASVKNGIMAIELLATSLTVAQREQLIELLSPIEKSHAEPRIRIDAGNAIKTLNSVSETP
ncbi:HEAT repeat domain-containing protein [Symmachiella dynata]|uniref:HEAT repeat domain-containing protein n=1 Tax=Symmachiella dynata TaxID=2527995 RepID=UPI0030EF5B2A